jgi:hypothetical protein
VAGVAVKTVKMEILAGLVVEVVILEMVEMETHLLHRQAKEVMVVVGPVVAVLPEVVGVVLLL